MRFRRREGKAARAPRVRLSRETDHDVLQIRRLKRKRSRSACISCSAANSSRSTPTNSATSAKLDIVGLFPDYASAEQAWRAKAQQTVDSAQTRYYIVHLHRLIEPDLAPPTRTA